MTMRHRTAANFPRYMDEWVGEMETCNSAVHGTFDNSISNTNRVHINQTNIISVTCLSSSIEGKRYVIHLNLN